MAGSSIAIDTIGAIHGLEASTVRRLPSFTGAVCEHETAMVDLGHVRSTIGPTLEASTPGEAREGRDGSGQSIANEKDNDPLPCA